MTKPEQEFDIGHVSMKPKMVRKMRIEKIEGQTLLKGENMYKAFALKETHFPTNNICIYSTLDRRVVHVVSRHPIDWPNRENEEVIKCDKCRQFVLPREIHLCRSLL